MAAASPAYARPSRFALVHGLDYKDDTTGVTAMVSNRKGAVEVARSLGEVWAAAEKLVKRPLDPLDPALLARLAGETSPG